MVSFCAREAARQKLVFFALIFLTLVQISISDAQTSAAKTGSEVIQPANGVAKGLLVESVEKGRGAALSGIKEGDILLRWQQGNEHGDLNSPFDLGWLDKEQRPRGVVVIDGISAGHNQTYVLGASQWGFKTRPNAAQALLDRATKMQTSKDINQDADLSAWLHALRDHPVEGMPVNLRAWFLYRAGSLQADARRWTESDQWYLESLDVAGLQAASKVQILTAWSFAHSQRSDYPGAEKLLQQALSISASLSETSLFHANALTNLGSLEHSRGNLEKAEAYYQQALAITVKLAPGSMTEALLLYDFGLCAQVRTELNKAEEYFKQSLSMGQAIAPDSPDLTPIINGLGFLYYRRGELSRAEASYAQTLRIETKLNMESLNVAWIFNSMGLIQRDYGNIDKAEEYFLKAYSIRKKIAPESTALIPSYTCLAIVAFARGDLLKAEQYQREGLRIREKTAPGSLGLAESLIGLGAIVLKRGDLTEAERYYTRALAIEEKFSPGAYNHANALSGLAGVYEQRGDLEAAEQYGRKALEIINKVAPESVDFADMLQDVATTLEKRGNTDDAERYGKQALAIKLKTSPESAGTAWSWMALGRLAQERGDWDNARNNYQQAVAIREKLGDENEDMAESLAALGGVYLHDGAKTEAERFFKRAVDTIDYQTFRFGGRDAVQAEFRARHESVYTSYIDLLLEKNQTEAAFSILEKSRARTLIDGIEKAHLDIGKSADPILVHKQSSLQANIRAKSDRRIRLIADRTPENQIREIEKEISDLTAEYQDNEALMRANSPAYASLTKPQPLNAKEIQQQLLDKDTVLLEYSLGDDQSHVFAVTSDSILVFNLPGRADIHRQCHKIYELLTARNTAVNGETAGQRQQRWETAEREYKLAAAELSRTILTPVAVRLGEDFKHKRLVIVADGALHYISFAALPQPDLLEVRSATNSLHRKASQSPGPSLAPLAFSHEIIYLSSASLLASLRQQAHNRKPALKAVAVLADPVFDKNDQRVTLQATPVSANSITKALPQEIEPADSGSISSNEQLTRAASELGFTRNGQTWLPRLSFSRLEADAILAVTPPGAGWEAVDFTASRATALSPELAQYRIVHFATHGLLNSAYPELSGLVLSLVDEHGQPRDGFLPLQDIYNMRLSADLVVLSACETGLGKEIDGEGLFSLTRGFMYAGAPRVVASLWKVSDAATAQLMSIFYRRIEQDHFSPAAALRSAQVELSKQKRWQSPYYWAAFQIQGDWN